MAEMDSELTGRNLQDFLENELTTLSRNLDDTFTVLSQKWIGKELTANLDTLEQNHQSKVAHYHDVIDGHVRTIKKIQDLASNNQKALEDQVQKLTELKQELKILRAQTQSARQDEGKLDSEISRSQQDIHVRREALERNSQETQRSLNELEMAASFYRDRLGLRFQKISGGRLQFCFSLLDRENPDTCCYFCLKINDDRTYTVSDFSPPVDDVEELETKLNTTNNLRSFMVAIRKRFIKALNSPK